MSLIKGYCFRTCNECDIFQATKQDDNEKRAEIAANLSELHDENFEVDDINCDGCSILDGRLFKFAGECSVRQREIRKLGN
jgi:hypothetical protein